MQTTSAANPPPDAPPPRRESSHRRADIQGLRGIAVLLVVAFHSGLPMSGGFIGVDVFFVISGFVITAMLLREIDGTGRVSFVNFYSRRARRILPALALTVSVVAIAAYGAVGRAEQGTTARTGVAAAFSVANMYLGRLSEGYFDAAQTLNPLLHTWSLSVEEQFYLFFPALLAVGAWLATRRRTAPHGALVTLVGLVTAGSFALSVLATNVSGSANLGLTPRLAFYLAPTRAWEFGVGALLGLVAVRLRAIGRAPAVIAGWVGLALILVAAFRFDDTTTFPGIAALLPVVGTALILVAGSATTGGLTQLLTLRPLTWTGDISYSWYLWHWPLIVFGAALFPASDDTGLIAAAISLVPAWLSWRFLETRIRADQRIHGRRALGLTAICLAVPTVICFALLKAPDPPTSDASRAFLRASARGHADAARHCNQGRSPTRQPDRCRWTVPDATRSVVLLGDSNAGHFTEPVAAAANELGYDFTVATLPRCPIMGLDLVESQREVRACQRFSRQSIDDVLREKPAVVVLAASTAIYLDNPNVAFKDPVTGEVARGNDAKANLWAQGLGRLLGRFADAGVPAVLIHPVPQWTEWDSRGCANVRVSLAPSTCGITQRISTASEFRRQALAAETAAARQAPSTVVLDPFPLLCRKEVCATNFGDEWLYRDGRHLSVSGSMTLVPSIEDALRAAAVRPR